MVARQLEQNSHQLLGVAAVLTHDAGGEVGVGWGVDGVGINI